MVDQRTNYKVSVFYETKSGMMELTSAQFEKFCQAIKSVKKINKQLQTFDETDIIKIGKHGKLGDHRAPCMFVGPCAMIVAIVTMCTAIK